jgi:hypothetical protein
MTNVQKVIDDLKAECSDMAKAKDSLKVSEHDDCDLDPFTN